MENINLAKSHGKVMEFRIFKNISHISFEKNVCTLLTHNDTDSPPIAVKYFTCKK